MTSRKDGYDLIRSVAILIVFFGHILNKQISDDFGLLILRTLAPGLPMSLLGFISGALLSKTETDFGFFLIKRFSRIYTSLFLCLTCILIYHYFLGKDIISQHALLHYLGMSAFFEIFLVKNTATIGGGLWFITAICFMYILLPLLKHIFAHRKGTVHFILFIIGCTVLQFIMYGTQSLWNIVVSFSLGVYMQVKGLLPKLTEKNNRLYWLFAIALIIISALSTVKILPYSVRKILFVFYPLAFVPIFFSVSRILPKSIMSFVLFFASISYEFYILHFYFINKNFYEIFPPTFGLLSHIIISFTITCFLSFVLSRLAIKLRKIELDYLSPRHTVTN